MSTEAPDPSHKPDEEADPSHVDAPERFEFDELDPLEFSLLQLTHDASEFRQIRAGSAILLGKSAYFWGAFIALLAERKLDIDEVTFADALRFALEAKKNSIRTPYLPDHELLVGHQTYTAEDWLAMQIILTLGSELGLEVHDLYDLFDVHDFDDLFVRLVRTRNSAYGSLFRKGLVEDPIEIVTGGLSIAVLGLIPTGFTMTTEKGRLIKLHYRSLLLDVDYKRTKAKRQVTVNTKLEQLLRIQKLITAFKIGFVDGFRRALAAPPFDPGSER